MRLNKLLNAVAGAALFASIVGCSDSTFKSGVEGGQAVSPPPGQQIPGLPPPPPPTRPLDNDQGGIKYSLCTALPKGGYAPLGACAVNEVIVIINDGKADGRTCCPIGNGILSTIPGEVNQPKPGLCGPDEVATGIKAMTVPYCTKINTQSFSLEPAGGAVYGTKKTAGLLGQLAARYNIGDCCACPEGTVMIGGHTTADNRCTDQCVKIVPKLK